MVIGSPYQMMAVRVSVHDRTRRRRVDVPHVMAGLTDVALRPAVLVREQGSHRLAQGTLSGASGEPVWNLVAGKASTPRGSTVDSRHG